MLKTIGFPGRYIQGPDALGAAGQVLDDLGFSRPVVLADDVVRRRVWPLLAEGLRARGTTPDLQLFPGECTEPVIEALATDIRPRSPDVVVALGGGKTIDTAKGVSRLLDLPIVICPTVASSDAPTSRLIVLYDGSHRLVGVKFIRRNPDAVIVDTRVIVEAPARFFAAGIGDALSKRFEARQCTAAGGLNSYGTSALNTALLLTDAVYDLLRRYGPDAYQAVRRGEVTEAVERVVEATVLVSGVGFESGGLSLAHALIRGLTAVPRMSGMLHGELVAFGTLVQLAVEEQPDAVIEDLLDVIEAVELPMTLAELGQAAALEPIELATIADATLATNYSRHMAPPLTAERLLRGLAEADRRGRSRRRRTA